jgi:zinc and cadmium transporter
LSTLWWIVVGGLLMSAIALVGSLTLVLSEAALRRVTLPLVALAAGSLLGGAFFHMLPVSVRVMGAASSIYLWLVAGFVAFFCLEQFLHWHHCHQAPNDHRRPLGYLVLIADGLHNLLGGLAVGAAFVTDLSVGVTTWIAAAAHEIPQELGDFGALIHSGWSKKAALAFNFLSALTFLVGGLLAYFAAKGMNVAFLVPFAAGNFIYIASVAANTTAIAMNPPQGSGNGPGRQGRSAVRTTSRCSLPEADPATSRRSSPGEKR